MTPAALFSGARSAVLLARECERDMDLYDADWARRMREAAKEHRARAARYLRSRKLLLRHPAPLEIAA